MREASGDRGELGPASSPRPLAMDVLAYTVEAASGTLFGHRPENVQRDDQQHAVDGVHSRWTGALGGFLLLRLARPAIIYSITFGKYSKSNVMNLREFRVYGGMRPEDTRLELLHSGLNNDGEPETFPVLSTLPHPSPPLLCPCLYVRIVPLASFSDRGNFASSVWSLQLRGDADPLRVQRASAALAEHAEAESLRLTLRHLRRLGQRDIFEALRARYPSLRLEEPLVTLLYDAAERGDGPACERVLESDEGRALLAARAASLPGRPVWTRIPPRDVSGRPCGPGRRGGHQMCIDTAVQQIYLLGGWSGTADLADFWAYDIAAGAWRLVSEDTALQGGPGPRSCHKVAFDARTRRMYVLGRYVDPEAKGRAERGVLAGDLFCFDAAAQRWELLSPETRAEGGPGLIYDHQMCVDSERQLLYVFGGRTIAPTPADDNKYSGLFQYDIAARRWSLLRSDARQAPLSSAPLLSRIGHSMLYEERGRRLYIFAGQRSKDYLADFYVLSMDGPNPGEVVEMSKDSSREGGPDAGFTQRATIDPRAGEIHVLSGLMRERGAAHETVTNSFWTYNLAARRWACLYHNERSEAEYWRGMADREPCPRFAHQLVLDESTGVHYLFGGNAGEGLAGPKDRLDDFWALRVERPSPEALLRRARFAVRRQRFLELCGAGDSMAALRYLQTEVAAAVDHQDEGEERAFRALSARLFAPPAASSSGPGADPSLGPDTGPEGWPALFESLAASLEAGAGAPAPSLAGLVAGHMMRPQQQQGLAQI